MIKRNSNFISSYERYDLEIDQEIKNYKDSLNGILQAIRELKEQMSSIRSESLKNYSIAHSQINDLKISIDNLQASQQQDRSQLARYANDSEAVRKVMSNNILSLSERIQENSKKTELTSNKVLALREDTNILKDLMNLNHFKTENALSNHQLKLEKAMGVMKDEILSTPSGVNELKKEMQQVLDTQKIDFEGLMRELTIWKRENQITQKKIENIYTLIGRLQKALPA